MRVARYYAEGGRLYERLKIDPEERREVDLTRRHYKPGRFAEALATELNKAVEFGGEVAQARIRIALGIRDR
jgi:hypothetical protein